MKKGIDKKQDHYRIVCVNAGRMLFNAKYDYDLCLMMFDKLSSRITDKGDSVKIVEYKNGVKTIIKQVKK